MFKKMSGTDLNKNAGIEICLRLGNRKIFEPQLREEFPVQGIGEYPNKPQECVDDNRYTACESASVYTDALLAKKHR